jgi:hypothetical protein
MPVALAQQLSRKDVKNGIIGLVFPWTLVEPLRNLFWTKSVAYNVPPMSEKIGLLQEESSTMFLLLFESIGSHKATGRLYLESQQIGQVLQRLYCYYCTSSLNTNLKYKEYRYKKCEG